MKKKVVTKKEQKTMTKLKNPKEICCDKTKHVKKQNKKIKKKTIL